jgi:RHS repeat-associated protein
VATINFNESTGPYNYQTLTWSTAGAGVPSLATWTDSNGTTQHTDFIYGPEGLPVEQVIVSGATVTPDWYYHDEARNTRVMMDSSGNVVQSYNYDDYGNYSIGAGSGGPTTPLLYQGLFTDTVGTGFVFMQARWYDPQTAEFVSRDPTVDQTLQPYAYAGDNPANESDPLGTMPYSNHGGGPCNSRWDRWEVKTGWDQSWLIQAQLPKKYRWKVNVNAPMPIHVDDFIARRVHAHRFSPQGSSILQRPSIKNRRYGLEKRVWMVTGKVICLGPDCKEGGNNDGDLSFHVWDGKHAFDPKHPGKSSVKCEMPNDSCTQGAPWSGAMTFARGFMMSHLPQALQGSLYVTVSGTGLWDTFSHVGDTTPELHPVLGVTLAGSGGG